MHRNERIEPLILAQLLTDSKYAETVLSGMEASLFQDRSERHLFTGIKDHFTRYASCPSKEELTIYIADKCGDDYEDALDVLTELPASAPVHLSWLIEQTEQFITRQGHHNFILEIIHRKDQGKPLPSSDEYAKAVSEFSFAKAKKHGHDLFEDCDLLYQHLNDANERLPFDVAELNRLTNGGVSRKTLNVILAPTNVGKSLMLCHLAAMYMRQGRKVLYVTLEMSQQTTAQRITANLLDVEMNSLSKLSPSEFHSKMSALRQHCPGELLVREYPALSVTVTNFKALLTDLRRSKKFIPDVVIVDYLNLCGAASIRKSSKADMYQTVGTIAAELHGFASEQNLVLWTATQTNRSGFKVSELELEHTSESYAVNSNADLILGLSVDENIPGTRTIKLLKNRNDGISGSRKTVVAVDTALMKLYDFDGTAPVMAAFTDMSKARRSSAVARVNAKRPKFAIDMASSAQGG